MIIEIGFSKFKIQNSRFKADKMQVQRWKNVSLLRNSLASSSHVHSTAISRAKCSNKWNQDSGRGAQPSKTYIRYTTRQKRADAKKALKDLLYNTTCRVSFQNEEVTWSDDENISNKAEDVQPKGKKSSKKSKPHHSKDKCRWKKRGFSSEYDVYDEATVRLGFGTRSFTWSWKNLGFQPSYGFEWRDDSNQTGGRWRRAWVENESDDDDETSVGSESDRVTLGLPLTGRLKIEDVKFAFRAAALKWHPDKHQGPSKEVAEEKFKLCADAYKSLCNALSA